MFVDDYSTNAKENEAETVKYVQIPTNMLSTPKITSDVTDDELIVYYEVMYHRSLQNPTQTNINVDLLYERLLWCKSKKSLGKNRIIQALQGLHFKGYIVIANVDVKDIEYTTYLQVNIVSLADLPNHTEGFMQITESTAVTAKSTNKTGQTFKVLMYALWRSRIHYSIPYKEWANLLNLDISNAKRIIKKLKEKNIIRIEKSTDSKGNEANHYYVDGENYDLIMQLSNLPKNEQLSFESQEEIPVEAIATSESVVNETSHVVPLFKNQEPLEFPIERVGQIQTEPLAIGTTTNDAQTEPQWNETNALQQRLKAFDDTWWEELASYLGQVEEGLKYDASQLKMFYAINARYDNMTLTQLLEESIDERTEFVSNFFKFNSSIQENDVIILLNTNCPLVLYYGVKRLSLIANSSSKAKTMVLNWLENAVKHHISINAKPKQDFYNWIEERDAFADTLSSYMQNQNSVEANIK